MLTRLFGERIAYFRQIMGLTQAELAGKVKVSTQYIGKIERGESSPSFPVIEKICKALRTDPVSLFLFQKSIYTESFTTFYNETGEVASTWLMGLPMAGTFRLSTRTRRIFPSELLCRMLGYKTRKKSLGFNSFLKSIQDDAQSAFEKVLVDLSSGKKPPPFPFVFMRKDGKQRYALAHFEFVSGSGHDDEAYGVITDVTDWRDMGNSILRGRDQLEQYVQERVRELAESKSRLEKEVAEHQLTADHLKTEKARSLRLMNSVPGVIYQYVLTSDGRQHYRFVSENVGEIFGCTAEDAMKDPSLVFNLLPPEDLEYVNKTTRQSASKLSKYSAEFRVNRPDGKQVWVQAISTPNRLPNGDTIFDGLVIDITERKRSEQDLALKGMTIETSFCPLVISDPNGVLIHVNPSFLELWGYDKAEDVIGRQAIEFWKSREEAREAWQSCLDKNSWSGELTGLRKDGREFQARVAASCISDQAGKMIGMTASLINITERKQIEDRIWENEELYRIIYNNTPVMLHSIDEQGRLLKVNDAWLEKLGYTREEVIGRNSTEFMAEESAAYVNLELRPSFFAEGSVRKIPLQFITRDGRIVDTLCSANVINSRTHGPYSLAVFEDVTEINRVQKELKAGEKRYQLALEAAKEEVWDWDLATGRITYSHDKLRMNGDEPLVDQSIDAWFDLIHPDDRDFVVDAYTDCLENKADEFDLEFRMQNQDGAWVWIRSRGRVVERDENGRAARMVGTRDDITNRKEAELALKQALAEKQMLFKEVHHRVKNNMQAISSLLNLQAIKEDGRVKEALLTSMNRISAVALAHEEMYQSESERAIQMDRFLGCLAGRLTGALCEEAKQPKVVIDLPKGLLLSGEQATHFGIAINEILTNCLKYAFSGRGSGEIAIEGRRSDKELRIIIKDDGDGFPEGFDPAKTDTLGLMLVQRIIEAQMRGRVDFRNNGGAEVEITMPV